MQLILLSGGSGSSLWPLSNDSRSKQFLRLLPVGGHGDQCESMVQRVVRQIREAGLPADITVATAVSQQDGIISQLGGEVGIVTEPTRRETFPAVCLVCEYLALEKQLPPDEPVVVMPCDPYTDAGYFQRIADMVSCLESSVADLILMGIPPTGPDTDYGYIVPGEPLERFGAFTVSRFTEKPTMPLAESLISRGALWNSGVYAFRLGYLTDIARRYVDVPTFADVRANYTSYPPISFDYEVAEKSPLAAVLPYDGEWKDLGNWNTLTAHLRRNTYGNVTVDPTTRNTHVINELDIPIMCIGASDLVVAASPDGILISHKDASEEIKAYASRLKSRPMYEERRWGTYKVIDYIDYPDGYSALTKHLVLHPGASISYQQHACRDEVWTFIDGQGEIVLDGERRPVRRGMTIYIPKGMRHALRATTPLSFIEVQSGSNLVETDITRYPYSWD